MKAPKRFKRIALVLLPPVWPKMPPLGLHFLQSFLKKNNFSADVFDTNVFIYNLSDKERKKEWILSCNVKFEESMLRILQQDFKKPFNDVLEQLLEYDVMGFSCFKSNFAVTTAVTTLLKERKKEIKIVLGGPEIARQFFKGKGAFDNALLRIADLLVVGEGELPLLHFLLGKNLPKKVTAFKQLETLDALSFPRYPGIDLTMYPSKNTLPIQFSRGCVRQCLFCSERLLYKGFRVRPMEGVVSEIHYHQVNNKVNNFVFFDSLINADLNALESICDALILHPGKIKWEGQIAVRKDMPQRLFEKIKRSGCYNLFVGLESGADDTLRRMQKGFTPDEAVGFFRQLHDAGLSFGVSMIIGFPGETEKSFRQSLDFLLKNKELIQKIEQVNPFTYYDGTPVDPLADYAKQAASLLKMKVFMEELKKHKFKYTNAFIGNLVEKNA